MVREERATNSTGKCQEKQAGSEEEAIENAQSDATTAHTQMTTAHTLLQAGSESNTNTEALENIPPPY